MDARPLVSRGHWSLWLSLAAQTLLGLIVLLWAVLSPASPSSASPFEPWLMAAVLTVAATSIGALRHAAPLARVGTAVLAPGAVLLAIAYAIGTIGGPSAAAGVNGLALTGLLLVVSGYFPLLFGTARGLTTGLRAAVAILIVTVVVAIVALTVPPERGLETVIGQSLALTAVLVSAIAVGIEGVRVLRRRP